ncbi:hypothetical protein TEA_029651 [Camellia sinensis var. sinensis]|uniref:Uncharacterized protein n=1 Tax=Camellia sinensis var. sinensis TaxID=542762 RepID=A0A4S4CYU4_CAMSN|nr:hypothetical protein TEA_029651 [Camellia sinensis var. sinensis]
MYSSIFGGIILDPAMMVIPVDDHMVHRGHGVFDTAIILDGWAQHLYELDVHLDRFLRSASNAKIPSPFPRSTLRTILIQLAATSQCRKGTLRYWLTAGPGDFLLTPGGCPTPAFYAIAIKEDFLQCKEGVKVITSNIPMKQPQFATMKNVNYLPNVLSKMEAEEKGTFASIWVDDEGFIAEGPNMNVAFITHDKELILPLFDKILGGCTALRLLELATKLVEQGRLKSVKTGNLTVGEAKSAAEMMYVGSTLPILPIIMWDDNPIGDGKPTNLHGLEPVSVVWLSSHLEVLSSMTPPNNYSHGFVTRIVNNRIEPSRKVGELTMALSDLLWDDMVAGPETHRLPVPY